MWERFPLIPEQASTFASKVDLLYYSLVVFSVFFSLLVFSLILVFAIRFRRREGRPAKAAASTAGNLRVEVVWTAIPFFLSIGLLVWGVDLYVAQERPPKNALDIDVIGKQWMWTIQHPTGQREINELHVPLGRIVKLTMATEDVIHSFFVPAFRVKQDVVPGRFTTLWFEATRVGEYHLFCAEYCGTNHSGMGGKVVVMKPADYESWLGADPPSEPPVAAGARLFEEHGCKSCHLAETGRRGPSLIGLPGREVHLQSGVKVVADEDYLRESILDPNAKMVAGFEPLMPTFAGQLTPVQLLQIIAYIKSLNDDGGANP
jgi:cytochrome c oxidase subunit II